jgi:hypothetical protein
LGWPQVGEFGWPPGGLWNTWIAAVTRNAWRSEFAAQVTKARLKISPPTIPALKPDAIPDAKCTSAKGIAPQRICVVPPPPSLLAIPIGISCASSVSTGGANSTASANISACARLSKSTRRQKGSRSTRNESDVLARAKETTNRKAPRLLSLDAKSSTASKKRRRESVVVIRSPSEECALVRRSRPAKTSHCAKKPSNAASNFPGYFVQGAPSLPRSPR